MSNPAKADAWMHSETKVCWTNAFYQEWARQNPNSEDVGKFVPLYFAPTEAAAMAATVPLADSRAGRVYLAGPMTGYGDWNFPAFNEAAAKLRANGLEVVNPAEHGIVPGAEWGDYLRYGITKLSTCASIALLPGWSKSKGAALEVHIANALGMTIVELDGAESAPQAPVAGQPAEPSPADGGAR